MNFTWRMTVGGEKVHAVRPPAENDYGRMEERALCGLVYPKHGWTDPKPTWSWEQRCKMCAKKASNETR